MIQNIPTEITITSFSFIGLLTGYIWNAQAKQILNLQKHQQNLPCSQIRIQITEIKNDLKWIKEKLK